PDREAELVSASQATDGGVVAADSKTSTTEIAGAPHEGRTEGAPAGAEQLRGARATLPGPGDYLIYELEGRVQAMLLGRELTRVGRSLIADLRFDDPTVSRRHALLVRELTGIRLLDDRSMYGVFVNGRRVDSRLLSDGDLIALGRRLLLYQRL